jgi:hypothetical protein
LNCRHQDFQSSALPAELSFLRWWMGNGSAYDYPEFVDEIKLAKAAQPKKIKTNKSNKRVLVAQSELVYNLFKSCDDPKFIIDAYEKTNNVLPIDGSK